MTDAGPRRQTVAVLAAAYVALMPLGWPALPLNMQLADLLFPALLVSVAGGGWRWRAHALDWALLAYLAGVAASVPGSLSIEESLIGFGKAAYLALVYLVLVQAVWRVGADSLCRSITCATAAIAALSLAAAVVFLIAGRSWPALGEAMPLPYVGTVFRLKGTLHSPEFFSNLLAFAAPLALYLALPPFARRIDRVSFAAILVAGIATFAKAIGGMATAIATVVWRAAPRRAGVRWTLALAAAVLVAAFNATAIVAIRAVESQFGKNPNVPPPAYQYGRQDDRSGADAWTVRVSYNPMSYYLLKRAEWHAFRRQPLAGIGVGTFHLEAERAFQEGRLPESYRRADPHSTPLGRLAETGIVGAVTLAVFIVMLLRTGISASSASAMRADLGWAVFAAVLALLVNSINVDILTFRFFWLGVALLRGLDRPATAS